MSVVPSSADAIDAHRDASRVEVAEWGAMAWSTVFAYGSIVWQTSIFATQAG